MAPNCKVPSEEIEKMPASYRKFMEGANVPAHVGKSLDKPPEWLDKEKFARGKEFSKKYFLSIVLSHLMTHVFLFAWRPAFRLFIFKGKTETYKRQRQRNVRMFKYLLSWYEGDIWDPSSDAHRNMKIVHLLHERAGTLGKLKESEVNQAELDMTLEPEVTPQCRLWPWIREDMKLPENNSRATEVPPWVAPSERCNFSQMDSSIAILTTIAPVLIRPDTIGIHDATREDFEGLIHLWRVIAYYSGVEDRFNPCSGTVEEVRQYSWDVVYGLFYPCLQNFLPEDEYYARVSFDSIPKQTLFSFITFDCYLLLICKTLELNLPNAFKCISWRDKFVYWLFELTKLMAHVPFLLRFLNNLFRSVLQKVEY